MLLRPLKASTALTGTMALMLSSSLACALPSNGQLTAGQAVILSSSTQTTINQTSARAVVNWSSFNLGSNQSIRFKQPLAASVTLNRVNGNAGYSQINGQITANGNVWIMNPNGMVFGNQARVNVGGLLATTSTITNANFMTGNNRFTPGGNPNASVVNAGVITVAQAGLAALVAPNVVNNGTITATLGKVQLASGDSYAIDMYGDGLINLQAGPAITSQIVSNSGTIKSNGGTVTLTAAAAGNVVDSLINMDGVIEAESTGNRQGSITLYAEGSNAVQNNVTASKDLKGGSSTVVVSGVLDASGYGTRQNGGTVQVLGDNVGILSGAVIDASGSTGGGTVRIGGNFHGQGATPTAASTYVDSNSLILANAVTSGNGGNVTVWSDGLTQFYGNIIAEGGAKSGNGGYVETSGHGWLDAEGYVDLTAPNGAKGTYLLDPTNISIYGNVTPAFVSTDGTINLASSLVLWLDASDTGNVQLTYNSASTTATGTSGSNTITLGSSAGLTAGARIQLGGSSDTYAASVAGGTDNIYTISSISGTTVTLTSNLLSSYSGSTVYEGYVSQLTDKSGQGNNATQATAADMPLWISNGQNGLGFTKFNGGYDYLAIPSASNLNFGTGSFTVNVSLEPNSSLSSYYQIIDKKSILNGANIGWDVWLDYRYTGVMEARINDGSSSGDLTAQPPANLSTPLNGSAWGYLSYGVNIGNNVIFSLNGINEGSTSISSMQGSISNSQPVTIGGGPTGIASFPGSIGDITIYNTALPTNAQALLNQYESAKWNVALTGPGVIGSETGLTGTEAQQAMASVPAGATTDGYSVFSASYLNRLSQTSNIILQASNNINLDLQGANLSLASGKSISLIAGNQITTNSTGSITTSGGNIALTGTNGIVFSNAFALTSGGGNITLNSPTTLNAALSVNSGGGAVTFSGTVNGANNLTVNSGAGGATFSGNVGATTALANVTVAADAITLPSALDATGTVTLQPGDTTTSIGFSGGVGTLQISQAMMNAINAPTVVIGRTDSTAALASGPFTWESTLNNLYLEGGSDTVCGNITKSSGTNNATLDVIAGTDITVNGNQAISSSSTYGQLNTILDSDYAGAGGAIVLNPGSSISSNGGNIVMGGGTGTITATSGYAVGDATSSGVGITIGNGGGATVNAGAGSIIMNGQGYAQTASNNYGLYIESGSTVQTSGSGTTSLTGIGGGTGASGSDYGLYNTGTVKSTAGTGGLTLIGYGGDNGGTGASNNGVDVGTYSTVSSVNGNVLIDGNTGIGGQAVTTSSGNNDYGVLNAYGSISSTGTATITLNGTGGGSSGTGWGVATEGSGTLISSVNGNIVITGTGASAGSSNDYGVLMAGGIIQSTGTATIGIAGSGGAGSASYGLSLSNSNSRISSVNSNITLTGTGSSGSYDIYLNNNISIYTTGSGNISLTGVGGNGATGIYSAQSSGTNPIGGASDTGNITLTADMLSLTSTPIQTTGTVTFAPYTASTTAGVAGGAGTLAVTNGILSNLTAGSIVIGNASDSGAMTIGAESWSAPVSFVTGNSGSITVSGAQTGAGSASLSFTGPTTLDANLTTASQNIAFNGPMTLGATSTINAGTATTSFGSALSDGSYNLTLTGDHLTLGGNVSGTGALTIQPYSAGTNIHINDGTSSGLYLSGTELGYIQSGFSSITLGNASDTGTMTLGAASWSSPLRLLSGSGNIAINGAQTMGANSLLAEALSGNITLGASGSLATTAPGTGITLAATAGNFTDSNSSASALSDPNGRWLIYSTNPSSDTFGGLTGNFNRYSCTYGGSCPSVPATGNGFLYSYTPLLTVTPNGGIGVTYGNAAPSLNGYGFTLSGYLGSDSGGDTTTGSVNGTTNYAQGSNIGSYALNYSSGSLASAMGYGFTYANNATAITVGARTLTATLTGTVDKTYDATTTAALAASNYVLSNVYGSDTVTLNDPASGSYNNANVGTGKTVSVSGLSLAGSSSGNYVLASTSISGPVGEIDAKTLTASLTGLVDKTYDQTTAATLAAGNYGLSGVISGAPVTLNDPTSGSYNNANVGTGKTVSVNGLTLGGSSSGNYVLASTSISGAVGEIDPKTLTATLTGTVDKTYDQTTAATLAAGNYGLSGIISGDTVTLNDPTSCSYNTANVGTGKTVSVSGLSLAGSSSGNYVLASSSINGAVGEIDAKTLTASLTGLVDKTYDQTTAATLAAGNYSLSGVINGDIVTLNDPSSGTYNSANVGTAKNVSVSGLSIAGASSGNYMLASTSINGGVGEIDAKTLTASLLGTVDKTYDQTTAAALGSGNYSLAGVISGDTVTLNNPALGTYDTANVGTGKTISVNGLTLGGSSSGNYALASTAISGAVGEIDAKTLTATLTGTVDKTYDQTTAATLTAGNYSLSGVIGGDTAVLNNPSSGSYNSANVGTGKTISVNGLSIGGASAGNYILASGAINGVVGEIDAKSLTATLTGTVDKTYDQSTVAMLASSNYSLAGIISGDTVSINNPASGTYDTANVGMGKAVSAGGLSLSGPSSGNYVLASSSISGAVGEIDPRTLIASLTGSVDKVYDGTTTATLTTGNYKLSGVVAGDSVALNDPLSGTYDNANFGARKSVLVDGLALSGGSAGNYRLASSAISGAVGEIGGRVVYVTAENESKLYGALPPPLSYSYSDAGNLPVNFTGGLFAPVTLASAPGTYAITQGTLLAGGNFDLLFTPATFNVIALPNVVTQAPIGGGYRPPPNDIAQLLKQPQPANSTSYFPSKESLYGISPAGTGALTGLIYLDARMAATFGLTPSDMGLWLDGVVPAE